MKRLLPCLLLAAALAKAGAQASAGVAGESGSASGGALAEALGRALALDPVYAQRLAEEHKAAASLAAVASPSPLKLSATSGAGRLSLPARGDPSLVLQPSLGVELSEPWETSASLGVYGSIDLADPAASTFKPSLSLSQPLSRLIWGPAPDASRAKLEDAVVEAVEAVARRESDLLLELCSDIRAARSAEYATAQARFDRDAARLALERARALGGYAESAAAMAKLRLDLAAAESTLASATRTEAFRKDELARLVGAALEPLPEPADPGEVAVPGPEAARGSLAALAARRARELALVGYQADYGPPAKSLTASLSASSAATDYGSGAWDYAGRLGFERGDLALTVGGGTVTTRGDGSRIPYATFRADWKPDNAAAKASGKAAAEASLEAQARAAEAALAGAEAQLRDFARQARELAEAVSLESAKRAYAAALLDEKTRARAAGLADDAELDSARWANEKLDFEAGLAIWDRVILSLKVAAMFPREGAR